MIIMGSIEGEVKIKANSKNNDKNLMSKIGKYLFIFLKIILYIFGAMTVVFYFFSFIGIIIGLIFLVFDKKSWRVHGAALAFAASLSQFIGHIGVGLSPLYLALITGLSIIFGYGIFCAVKIILKRIGRFRKFGKKIIKKYKNLPKIIKLTLLSILIISPIGLWSSVSINTRVLFDNEPRVLWINAPSTVEKNQTFTITVEAWDIFERLSATYTGKVSFSIESYNITDYSQIIYPDSILPENYTFTGRLIGSDMAYYINNGKDNGLHNFDIQINTSGIHYIKVYDSYTKQTYYSNPIIVKNYSKNQPHLYWGDIHSHSMLSDGSGSAEHAFYYAKNVASIDFYALTEHSEIMNFIPNALTTLEQTTQQTYIPNEFVTFQGIEWTDVETGHYVIIFSGDTLIKKDINSYYGITRPEVLWNALDDFTNSTNCKALALPHHPTKKAYIQDWTYLNPEYVRIAEVCSVHGDFLYEQRDSLNYRGAIDPPDEYTNGSSITDALRMGYKLTLYASGDSHDGHPGHSISHTEAYVGHQRPYSTWHTRNEHPYPSGLTAAWSPNLTRESIFDALYNQRIFAVSDFGRPIINFTIDGVSVGNGSTLYVDNLTDSRNISIFLAQDGSPSARKLGTTNIDQNLHPDNLWSADIEILKNGELLTTIPIISPVVKLNYTDNSIITGANYGAESCIYKDGRYFINDFSDNPIDPSTLNTDGADFYIVRLVKANGRMAWAGPIWVEKK
ncbi:MAG: DUF3604 domain-containing protein [Candidatus Lokiarchaeota archaeon]|nr:DUF3604 domain-containing protein [Candidatus Lokiarchaeota archaeon]